jgi:hypothetical protein
MYVKQNAAKLNSFGASCLRIILRLQRAESFHDHTKTYQEARLPPLANVVKARRLQFVGHQLRINDNEEPACRFALYEPPESLGKRRRGAQRQSFKHQIAADITSSQNY